MRRRWPQILSTLVVLLLALVVALINAQGGADGSPTATARPASAIAAAPSTTTTRPATSQASANATATRPPPTATRTRSTATVAPTARTLPPTPTPDGALPTIPATRLPKEAQETIRLIDQGGPFPYDRDGITFGNRERLLPLKSDGYYREYTVITPGSSDRGARRIVAGREGELYYTDDHYESFRRIVR